MNYILTQEELDALNKRNPRKEVVQQFRDHLAKELTPEMIHFAEFDFQKTDPLIRVSRLNTILACFQ